jgi:predicted ester cyclase
MNREDMQTLAHEMVEVTLNQKQVEDSDRYWKPDMIWRGPAGLGVLHGLDEFKNKLIYPFFKAFPDYIAINDLYAVDEERQMVTAWGWFTGTHQDVWAGVEATGTEVKVGFMDIWRIEDDKLAENWVLVDVAGMMEQVGALQMPETLADAAASR